MPKYSVRKNEPDLSQSYFSLVTLDSVKVSLNLLDDNNHYLGTIKLITFSLQA
ncbi:hypothetical protein TUM3792_16360 [Shewanella sp. MBTL60-007]|nr:hypothetical protein TUM3792_16360 [Shewanella sp. MBTL60-007]